MGGGVAVCGHQHHARIDQSGLWHHLVTHAAHHVKVMGQAILLRKLPHQDMCIGCFNGRTRGIMIEYEGRFILVPHLLAAHIIERPDGLGVQVVDLCKIHFYIHDLPRP